MPEEGSTATWVLCWKLKGAEICISGCAGCCRAASSFLPPPNQPPPPGAPGGACGRAGMGGGAGDRAAAGLGLDPPRMCGLDPPRMCAETGGAELVFSDHTARAEVAELTWACLLDGLALDLDAGGLVPADAMSVPGITEGWAAVQGTLVAPGRRSSSTTMDPTGPRIRGATSCAVIPFTTCRIKRG